MANAKTTKGRLCRPFVVQRCERPLRGARELVAELELQAHERLALELPDALTGEAELLADRLERRGLAREAEAELDDPPLPLRQLGDRALHALAPNRLDGFLGRVDGGLVGEQVAELRVAVRAEALVQRDRVDRVERLLDVLALEAGRLGQLVDGGLASELGLQLGGCA